MKNTLITAITGLTMISGLNAQYLTGTSNNYGGNTTYHSFSDGTSGTSSNYGGNTTYHSFGNSNGTSSNYGGNTTYHSIWD